MEVNELDEFNRERRRKRRKRNKFLAVMVVVIFVALIIAAGVFIWLKIDEIQKENKRQDEVSEKLEELTEDETDVPVITQPDVEVEIPPVDPLEEALKEQIAQMTIEDKIAGMFFVTPESITGVGTAIKAGNGTKEALEKFRVG